MTSLDSSSLANLQAWFQRAHREAQTKGYATIHVDELFGSRDPAADVSTSCAIAHALARWLVASDLHDDLQASVHNQLGWARLVDFLNGGELDEGIYTPPVLYISSREGNKLLDKRERFIRPEEFLVDIEHGYLLNKCLHAAREFDWRNSDEPYCFDLAFMSFPLSKA